MSVYTYRHGSIFWALTLIGVGAIFLWQNFNSAIHPWQLIAKFWPILIIFWGLSRRPTRTLLLPRSFPEVRW